ncbi:MAG: hypothetical protein IKP84_08995 [Prevotella sp.]|nr:hypothetical protein [Prevotella sp.]
MPRQPRTFSGTGIYHVMLRGINHLNRRTNRRMSELRAELAPAFPSEKEEDEVNNPPALVVRQ